MGFDIASLPVFPWDLLEPYKRQACAHPGGIVDLSVGTPVDPTPLVLQEALSAASDAPGYPATAGTQALREAVVLHYRKRRGVLDLPSSAVLPTIGSKEFVAQLPSLLGLGSGDVVVHPPIAYPTYDVGARLAGAQPLAAAWPEDLSPEQARQVKLVYLNSPANPTGTVLSAVDLRRWVEWARPRGVVVANDECYATLPWVEPYRSVGVPSILDQRVTGGSLTGVLAIYSLSKQSNAAGYRAAWVAGDAQVVARLTEVRRHIGLMVPAPVQAAMLAELTCDDSPDRQYEVYARRRSALLAALERAGYVVIGSDAGLYLWFTTEDAQNCWATVADLAAQGILVAPGEFYGSAARAFVRAALTASDAAVAVAASRLAAA
jgi:succinyldiaminopimelate transaminase